jgi:hypothetical protein
MKKTDDYGDWKTNPDDWFRRVLEDFPVYEGWDMIEHIHKIREMMYKKENGLPYDEEKKYLREVKRNLKKQDDAFYARLKAKREEQVAYSKIGGGYSQVAEPAGAYG